MTGDGVAAEERARRFNCQATLCVMCHVLPAPQANTTDNVPLHVLGGNIVPMALGKQFMLTRDVRNASLAFVVAFPAENSTATGSLPLISHLPPFFP